MHTLSATVAKNTFATVLVLAGDGGVQIEKHGKIVAVVVAPENLLTDADRRRAALARQEAVEAARLIRHQQIAIELLSMPATSACKRIAAARKVVDQWEARGTCSKDFIGAWRRLLGLPVGELAREMSGDPQGWGRALRQNSPWSVLA